MSLNVIEKAYAKTLRPELKKAVEGGEPERAASFAKALAKLYQTARRRCQTLHSRYEGTRTN